MNLTPEMILRGYLANTASLEEMLSVKGKTAIVTGGTSGLGFCVARRLCQGGAKVVIAGSGEGKGELAVKILKEENLEVTFCKTNIRKEEEVERLVAFTAEIYGSVDILVTAAGIWSFAHIEDLPEDVFKDTLDVNLLGAYRCAKYVSRYMIEHKIKGKMLLVSSNSAYLPQPVFGGYAHYTASKGGVIAMTTELAKELKRYGIMVNTVAPGGMFTPGCLTNGPIRTLSPEKQAELGKEMMVAKLDEIPTADSVAIVVYGMCTRMADGVTGECIVADSGMMRNIMAFQPAIEEYPPKEG
ncbi:SDR family NAD(P)-dependent oxidoreductase [Laedolimicola ammoniilytica]|uniref:SDR family oxidoreductase n=1 Tax=Laedolimicola ammoniilytica TaxID=2981771 RepID=A0ABT2RZG6_9FIRM|nr:SDR family oxidoreductase [Laedolimicola ammoniilytica]MCU6697405.1 SDR family oxidoreductase [Laedolimicola ammoniilytica]SCH75570.1 Glucose 1-dehydrogenase [uncultured Clostridium sp.]SCI25823.1 Glucose 1-dehydrogenase [uncultured Clostridium sp.]